MSGAAQIDFSSIGGKPVASGGIDFSSIGGIPVQQPTTAAQQPQDSFGSRVWQGVKQSALGQIWETAIAPPQNSVEAHVALIGGPQTLTAYRVAKNLVSSAENIVKASGDKYTQAVHDFSRMAEDYQNRDYRNLAADVGSAGSDFLSATNPVMAAPAQEARAISEGTRPGANLATPLTRGVIDAGTAAIGAKFAAPEEAAAEPSFAQKVIKGERVSQGPATQAVSKTAGTVAETAGVEAPAGNPVSSFGDLGDNVLAKAKSQYQALDDATGGRFQRFQDRLDNIHDKMNELTGTEEDVQQEAKLLQAQKETEDAMSAAFEDAKAAGIDPQTVDQAKAAYKQGNALKDLDAKVVQSRVQSPDAPTDESGLASTVDPKKLWPRLDQMYRSGRLQQAIGQDNAVDLLKQTKDFSAQGVRAARIQQKAGAFGELAGKAIVGGALGGAAAGLGYELVK